MAAQTQGKPQDGDNQGKLLTPRGVRWLIIGLGVVGLLLSAGLLAAFLQF